MTRTPIVIFAVAAIALGVGIAGTAAYVGLTGRSPAAPSSSAAAAPPSPVSPTVDPYEVYLRLAPKGAPKISREDAQTRALLGCGQRWAPGTVDAALAEAYADLCKQRQ